jgi:hypothetical protein
VDREALKVAQSDLATYSHCDENQGCVYNCSTPDHKATLGSWNISLLLHQEEGDNCLALNANNYSALKYEYWDANVQLLLGTGRQGFWFSTLKEGDGVTWSQTRVESKIAKACSDEVHYAAVEAHGRQCFAAAGPGCKTGKGRDKTAECWIDCYYSAVLGPSAGASYNRTGGMSLGQLAAAWEDAFVSCPQIKRR